jgi:hypothetical protein
MKSPLCSVVTLHECYGRAYKVQTLCSICSPSREELLLYRR